MLQLYLALQPSLLAVWCVADEKYQATVMPSMAIMPVYFLIGCFILIYLNLCAFLANCSFISDSLILSNMTFYVMPKAARYVSCPILSY